MAKGGAKPAVVVQPMKTLPISDKVFVSSKGAKIPLRPVSQFLLDSMRSSREEVPVPTYEVDLPGGDKETLKLDEISAENQGRMDEWKKYLKDVDIERNEFGTRYNDMIISEGLDLDAPGPDSDWEKKCKSLKLKIPEDPIKRKVFYVQNELLGTPEDIGNLVTAVYAASKFAPEVIEAMQATFRLKVEEQKNKRVAKKQVSVANE